jgi:hypothetical protein
MRALISCRVMRPDPPVAFYTAKDLAWHSQRFLN